MAPPKKPAARRVRSQTKDIGLVKPAKVARPAPPHHSPSKRLLVETVRAWDGFWDSDLAALTKTSDLPALVRLFRLYDVRTRLERLVVSTPMVEGSKGQPRVNPVLGELAGLDGRILQLEDRFGLSPAARLKLGVSFGQAARSLEELNREFEGDDDEDQGDEDDDPRLRAIDATSS